MVARPNNDPKDPAPRPVTEEEQQDQLPQEEMDEKELDKVAGGIISPRDAASGLPTGQRMHKPF
jgi:hypothetical protein